MQIANHPRNGQRHAKAGLEIGENTQQEGLMCSNFAITSNGVVASAAPSRKEDFKT